MKSVKLLLAQCVALSLLTACGNSGGVDTKAISIPIIQNNVGVDNGTDIGNGSDTTDNSSGTTNTTTDNNTTNTTTNDPSIDGDVKFIYNDGNYWIRQTREFTGTPSINVLNVGGQTFNLDGEPSSNLHVGNYSNVYYGYANHQIHYTGGMVRNDPYVFSQGKITQETNMPTSGEIDYAGEAIYLCVACNNSTQTASVTFNANFDTKKLTGEFNNGTGIKFDMSADIASNKFTGRFGDGYAEMSGAFFGDNAEQLGGTFENRRHDIGVVGAFGAEKQ